MGRPRAVTWREAVASRIYHLVDVFTERAFGGNPLAVFLAGQDIPESLYQPIAKELNLAESTFVLPPDDPANHFRVRIFTPGTELPMAGHPTVGTAYVLIREGRFDLARAGGILRLEEGVGPVQVTVEGGPDGPGMITMEQPQPQFGPEFHDRATVAALLSLEEDALLPEAPVQVVSCGVPFWYVGLRSLEAIRRVRVRLDLWDRHFRGSESQLLFLFTLQTETPGASVHARMFGLDVGLVEDPATGSAAGPLGCYLVRHGLVARTPRVPLICEQGFEIGRPSFIHIAITSEGQCMSGVHVGGHCVYMGSGTLEV